MAKSAIAKAAERQRDRPPFDGSGTGGGLSNGVSWTVIGAPSEFDVVLANELGRVYAGEPLFEFTPLSRDHAGRPLDHSIGRGSFQWLGAAPGHQSGLSAGHRPSALNE